MPDSVMNMEAAPAFRNRSAGIAALAAALAAAQKNFAPIPKDREVTVTPRTGSPYKFKYATLDAIMSATMPALSEQGLALTQALTTWGDNFALETTLYHSSGEWMSNVTPMFMAARRTADGRDLPPGNQELGSAQTYARRYGITALLCITADEDDDGNHADGNHATGERIPFKPGARGTAGGGTQFRPERRAPATTGQALALAREEGERDGLTQNAPPKPLPGAPAKRAAAAAPADNGNAVKRLEWVKASRDYLSDKDEHVARDWWVENKTRIDVIETALPKAFDELLDTYNQALERKVNA